MRPSVMDRPPLGDVQDLATLAKLDETILLDEIKERYRQDKIYTYVGDILLAVNPLKDLGIYTEEFSTRYQNKKQSAHPPHIFAVADAAYQALVGHGGRPPGNQCILISGESGAGKTESTKLIIKQLVELCKGNTQLEQQIIQVNPLLEAFGNAQTNLNDNSSRFGKFIQLKFINGHVVGAKISEYLLEKSRVVYQNPGEETFHIFYYLFAANRDGIFGLGDPDSYRYISGSARGFSKKLSTLYERYENLVNVMDLVGFTDEEQQDMFAAIASVLHLGNVSFKDEEDDSINVTDSTGPVDAAARLLGIDTSEMEACLTCMVTVTKGEFVKRNYTIHQAEDARDAMAKAVYGRLFGWIVNRINRLLVPEYTPGVVMPPMNDIGILDIFGFEDSNKGGGMNSFEQACINLANEQLQFFFNQHIFKLEQEEYQREGIQWAEIKFVDNKPLLDMFLVKPIGIFSLLDEESLFPKGTDQSFVDKMVKAFSGNSNFATSQQTNKAMFSINHYAGKVQYSADKWIEKNRDTLPPGITESLQYSSNNLIRTIFRGNISRTGTLALRRRTGSKQTKWWKADQEQAGSNARKPNKRKLTVSGQFKNSLSNLMERMMSSSPIFVRCLKPNHQKFPGDLDTKYLLDQLLYTGMLETTEIRRKGFAVRPLFQDFVNKYNVLLDLKLTGSAINCSRILQSVRLQGWFIGKTKVFLKYSHVDQLTDLLDRMSKSAVHMQRVVRGFLARCEYRHRQEHARQERIALEATMKHALMLNETSSQHIDGMAEQDRTKRRDNMIPGDIPPRVQDLPKDAIPMMASSSNYLELEENQMLSTNTQMVNEGSSDSDYVEDDCEPVASGITKYGRPGTKHATVNWFKETQTYNVMNQEVTKFEDWFHGIISRKNSETLLKDKIVGSFLIRVSESRLGYTLSFTAENRCRHYMIDQLKNGKFIIVGEPKVHKSLHNLVSHHKKIKISNWNHFLTVPCGQHHGECDYHYLIHDDVYHLVDPIYQSFPSRVSNNDSVQSSHKIPKGRQEGRPLPKLPETAYEKLMSKSECHDYNALCRPAAQGNVSDIDTKL